MKTVWKWLAWIFFLCGLVTYLTAWLEVLTGSVFWSMTDNVLFSDSIATGIFALFFLAWGSLSARQLE